MIEWNQGLSAATAALISAACAAKTAPELVACETPYFRPKSWAVWICGYVLAPLVTFFMLWPFVVAPVTDLIAETLNGPHEVGPLTLGLLNGLILCACAAVAPVFAGLGLGLGVMWHRARRMTKKFILRISTCKELAPQRGRRPRRWAVQRGYTNR